MISKNKLGVVIGSEFGIWHLGWALLVEFGISKWLIDWTFRLHFIEPVWVITAFRPGLAVALIVVTSILGFFTGWVAAGIWNWLQAKKQSVRKAVPRHA